MGDGREADGLSETERKGEAIRADYFVDMVVAAPSELLALTRPSSAELTGLQNSSSSEHAPMDDDFVV